MGPLFGDEGGKLTLTVADTLVWHLLTSNCAHSFRCSNVFLVLLGHRILCKKQLVEGLLFWWLLTVSSSFFSCTGTSSLGFRSGGSLAVLTCFCCHHRIWTVCLPDQVIQVTARLRRRPVLRFSFRLAVSWGNAAFGWCSVLALIIFSRLQ